MKGKSYQEMKRYSKIDDQPLKQANTKVKTQKPITITVKGYT